MSSYAELTLGSLSLATSRNRVDSDLIWLFRPSDKRIERIDRRNREQIAEYITDEYIDYYDENNPLSRVEYRCTASVARDRLDLKGFTFKVAESSFKAGLKREIQFLEALAPRSSGNFGDELGLLCSLTITDWLEALGRIQNEVQTRDVLNILSTTDAQLPLLRYMLGTYQGCYGFPGLDDIHFAHFLRLAVEAVSPQEQLVYDLTHLIGGGWIDEVDEQVAQAETLMYGDLHLAQKVIVLTEGDTDRQVLERSLKLLYPHLSDYFHFFGFTGRKAVGGAGELANLVRAFVGADVRHRILALFDNDTAARASLSNLDSDAIPKNIAVRHYPNTALAQDYPTLGPSGRARMDVNGLAGSLEMYLGKDVLENTEGVLTPVQWSGYDGRTRAYQGVVVDKARILKDFYDKLARCEAHPEEIESYDWEGIRAILNVMFTAFHAVDAKTILASVVQK